VRTSEKGKSIQVAVLVAAFLVAIVVANLALTHWGPSAIIPNAFFLIGLDLITRDRLADFWGTTRWIKMTGLIAAGGAISYYVNRHAATIAEASVISFAAAEICEAIAYHVLRNNQGRRPRSPRLMADEIDARQTPPRWTIRNSTMELTS
jgi:hypothetical protein